MPAGVECGPGATREVRVKGMGVMLLEEYLPVLEVEKRGLQRYYRIAKNYQGSRKNAVAHLSGRRIYRNKKTQGQKHRPSNGCEPLKQHKFRDERKKKRNSKQQQKSASA